VVHLGRVGFIMVEGRGGGPASASCLILRSSTSSAFGWTVEDRFHDARFFTDGATG
jgi:hypothetical protein